MSHWTKFSMPSIHVLNAKREINLMKEVSNIKFDINSNDYDVYNEIFRNNVQHGVLAIYSINAALESIITILSKELNLKKNIQSKGNIGFYDITIFLRDELKIITDINSYNKCIELRSYRNIITHWDKNDSTLLGTSGYLPFMFENGGSRPNSKKEKLISILTKEKLEDYKDGFNKLLENITSSLIIQEKEMLKHMFRCIIEGCIVYEG